MNLSIDTTSNKKADGLILTVLIVSFSIGTVTHFIDIIKFGFLGYSKWQGVSIWHNIFWTSLLIIDPIIIFLLVFKRNSGAISGFIILVIDVYVNHNYITENLGLKSWETSSFSLQAACLFFSAVSLPKLLVDESKNIILKNIILFLFSKLPLIVLLTGLIIHLKGLISLFVIQMTMWSIWVHFFMILFDAFLFFLVLKNSYIGFWIGIISFSIWGLIQIGYAIGSISTQKIPFNIEMGIYLSVCCLTVISLLLNKNQMNEKLGVKCFKKIYTH